MSAEPAFNVISVIRLRYSCLTTAAEPAQAEKPVVGVCVKQTKADAISGGAVPFVEGGLEPVVAGVGAKGTMGTQADARKADANSVAAPTPFKAEQMVAFRPAKTMHAPRPNNPKDQW